MNELRFLADRAGLHEGTPWVLLDSTGQVVRQGYGLVDVPPADELLLIVPDQCITVLSVTLPKLAPRQLLAALPAVVEDQLMAPVESTDLVVLENRPEAPCIVAAWSIEWRDALLNVPSVMRVPSVRVVAESWGLPLLEGASTLLLDDKRCVLRLPDWTSSTDERHGDSLPPLLGLALREIEGPLRVFLAAEAMPDVPGWISTLRNPIEMGQRFDWRTASFSAQPCLYQRRRVHLDTAAAARAMRLPALIAGAWLLFELIAVAVDVTALRSERSHLRAGQEKIFREVFGPSMAMVDAELQLRRRLNAARAAAGEPAPQDFLALMTRLADDFPNPPQAIREISYEDAGLTLRAHDSSAGGVWQKAAEKAGLTAKLEPAPDGSALVKVGL